MFLRYFNVIAAASSLLGNTTIEPESDVRQFVRVKREITLVQKD